MFIQTMLHKAFSRNLLRRIKSPYSISEKCFSQPVCINPENALKPFYRWL